jgi:hypothetical protein
MILTIYSECFPKQHYPAGLSSEELMFPVRYNVCILPTQCICVLHMILTINSDPFQIKLPNNLGFVVERLCVSCEVKTLHSAHTVYLGIPYGSHNKQRLFPHLGFVVEN